MGGMGGGKSWQFCFFFARDDDAQNWLQSVYPTIGQLFATGPPLT
jgi:hypothetical protein